MESGDLPVTLGLSCCRSDWQYEGMKCEVENLFRMFAIKTVSAYLIRISEFRMIFKYHGSRRGEI